MAHTPIAILIAATRELTRRADAADDSDDFESLACDVASEFGVSLDELMRDYHDQIAEAEADSAAAADFEEASYGSDLPAHDGPARLHDDDHYARNDAGEYRWM